MWISSFPQHHLLKGLSFLHCVFLHPVKNQLIVVHGLISGLYILFSWSICLSLCQYHTIVLLQLCNMLCIRCLRPQLVRFPFVIVLAIGVLCGSKEFQDCFFFSVNICPWDFGQGCIKSVDHFWVAWTFYNIKFFQFMNTGCISIYLYLLCFHSVMFCSFQCTNSNLFSKIHFRYFVLFDHLQSK